MDDETIRIFKAAMVLEGVPDKTIKRVVSAARKMHKQAIGGKFTETLDAYYAKLDAGERVKLRDMARDAGVNEGSLRQAKIRYDEDRRKSKG